MSALASDDVIRRWAAERHLPEIHLARWLALLSDDRAAILKVAESLRLRTGQLIAAFELLEEIALREHVAIDAILATDEIRRILDGAGSAPGRARGLLDALRVKRFPQLQRMADRLAAEIRGLGLPGGIKVVLPKELSSDEIRIEISARGDADLQNMIDAVTRARSGLGRIADLTGGAGSIEDEI